MDLSLSSVDSSSLRILVMNVLCGKPCSSAPPGRDPPYCMAYQVLRSLTCLRLASFCGPCWARTPFKPQLTTHSTENHEEPQHSRRPAGFQIFVTQGLRTRSPPLLYST